MRREDALRHARECFQWAVTTRDPKNRAIFLDAAKTWELLAQDSDLLAREAHWSRLSALVTGQQKVAITPGGKW